MGIDNALLVSDNQLKASTEQDKMHSAASGRLYNEFGGWSPRYSLHIVTGSLSFTGTALCLS